MRVCCHFLTPSGCSLMCQDVVATFSGFIFRLCVCLSSCPEKKNELPCALFLCLQVGLNIRLVVSRSLESFGFIRIPCRVLPCIHPLAYLNRCKYKQPRQSVFFQWCVAKSHQKHDYDRVCFDFNGCLGL